MADDTLTAAPPPTYRPRKHNTFEDSYLPLNDLATYTGLSTRTLWGMLKRPTDPLPHYRFGHRVVVLRSDFDAWARKHHRVAPRDSFDAEAYVDAKMGKTGRRGG